MRAGLVAGELEHDPKSPPAVDCVARTPSTQYSTFTTPTSSHVPTAMDAVSLARIESDGAHQTFGGCVSAAATASAVMAVTSMVCGLPAVTWRGATAVRVARRTPSIAVTRRRIVTPRMFAGPTRSCGIVAGPSRDAG